MVGSTEKQKFRGFEQARSSAADDIRDVLGIRIDPKIRLFVFKPDESLNRLQRLRRVIAKSRLERKFLEKETTEDMVMRGVFLGEHNALLVRPDDMFAQYHELGHAYVHGQAPDLLKEIANIKASGADSSFAKYAFDEGFAQWVAIKTALGQQDPEKQKQGIREHNRLVGKSANEAELTYDSEIVLQKLSAIRGSIKNCIEDPIVKKGNDWEAIGKKYAEALVKSGREALAIGYVYSEALVNAFMKQPGGSTASALGLLAKRSPSSLDQIEQEITRFEGFS